MALRHRYPGHRIWAVFEPRSNTTRRAIFQQQLPDALGLADGVFLSEVARLDQIPAEERLHPEAVVEAIAAAGKPAFYEKNADAILRRLVPLLQEKRYRGGFQQWRIRWNPRQAARATGVLGPITQRAKHSHGLLSLHACVAVPLNNLH